METKDQVALLDESTPGLEPPMSETVDSRESLVALATAVRWGTTTVGLLWAAALRSNHAYLGLGVVLLAYSLWRTYRPVLYRRRDWKGLVSILVELLVTTAVVVATGCWDSPYIFVLFTPVIAAGFARGFWHAFRIGVAAAVAVGLAAYFLDENSGIRPATAWSGEFLLVAAVASYGSRLMTRAEEASALNLSQVWRLNEANSLLVSLNQLAHEMPVSFDFQDTVTTALSSVHEATNPDVIALLLLEPLSLAWSVAMAEGVRLPESYVDSSLPAGLASSAHGKTVQLKRDLNEENPGLGNNSRAGIYVPLYAGQRQVGLLVVEADDRDKFEQQQVDLMSQLSESIALTIDNARWFDRLRARGAAQERTRIARDLHDRVGQDMAYVAFELDGLAKRAKDGELSEDINRLRTEARSIVSELRETLYDLRTDVSSERGFESVAKEFLARVAERSNVIVHFESLGERRIALAQERQVWRICQEAVTNVERHADATSVSVIWQVDDHGGALLTISDDGIGIRSHAGDSSANNYADSASPGRPSYGLTGMRERAESIGGVLEIGAGPNGGTVVSLALGARRFTPNHSESN